MAYNIGPKIGIDGEREFRDSIKKINDQYKALEAETRAVTASFEKQGDEQGKLEATSKQLQKQIDVQKSKVTLLEGAVQKATAAFGENSIEATRLRGALYDTQASIYGLEKDLRATTDQLNDTGDAIDDITDNAIGAGDAVLGFGDVLKANLASGAILDTLKDIGEIIKDIAVESIEASAEIRASSAQFDQAFGDMEDSAEGALQSISDETKIAETRMQSSFTKIFAFTKSVGADSEKALDISSRALLAAADSAAYYDRTIEEAAETLQSFLKGNYANDAALGIAATETTRNAEANRLYAKSFQELTEAQRVDVLLSMVEAGNAASGALGGAARESEEWTNVNGELTESWRQFLGVLGDPLLDATIPSLQAVNDLLKKTTSALSETSYAEELANSMTAFSDSVAAANSKFQDSERDITASAYAAEYYIDRLEELEKAGLDTAVAQQEYQLVVEQLNKAIPDLNLTINEQTGLIEGNTDAIRADIKAWKERATATALQEKFSDVLKAHGVATAEVIEKEARLNILVADGTELAKQRDAVYSKLQTAESKLTAAKAAFVTASSGEAIAARKASAQLAAAETVVISLTQEYESLKFAVETNSAEQEDLQGKIADAKETLASYADDIQVAEEAVRSYEKTTSDATDSINEHAQSVESTSRKADRLAEAYQALQAEASTSINAQIGLFDELAAKSDYSAEKIIKNWEAQQAAFSRYQDNLQKAMDMGLDQVLVEQLSDGTEQSMLILDALVNDTEISIAEINAAFGNVEKGRAGLASAMAEIRMELDGQLKLLKNTAFSSGEDIVDGLIAGAESRSPAFSTTLSAVGLAGMKAFNKEMQINSPARKMVPSGAFTVEGAIVGAESMRDDYAKTLGDIALAGENSFLSAQLRQVGQYPSVVQVPASYSRSVAHHYGGQTFQIYQQPGESAEDLAYKMMEIMQHEVETKEAGIGVQ